MRRREFIAGVGCAAAWPRGASSQPNAVPKIGYVSSLTKAHSLRSDAALRRGLSEMGFVEGQNASLQYRWIKEGYDELPAMVAELLQSRVDVIVAIGPPATIAAKQATRTTPIVFVTGADPIKFGFVASFNKPGGNVTGIWMVLTTLAEKRLQLLHDLLPKAERIALLVNPSSPVAEPQMREVEAAAQVLGVKVIVLKAIIESDFNEVSAQLAQLRPEALFVSADPLFASKGQRIVALAAEHSIPAIYEFRELVEAGGLISYGTVLSDGYYRAGHYVGRILKGAAAADLPVEKVDKFELVINNKTAKTLGITISDKLLATADDVIE